jgi:Domain of unknown function (DUF222)
MRLLAADQLPYKPPEAHALPPYADVTGGLAALDESGPAQLTPAALRDDLKWFAGQQRALEAMSARWLAELDRREPQSIHEDLRAPARWLCDELKLTSNQAYAQIRTARALDGELRLTAGALRRGEISAQHVAVIRRANEQVEKTCLDPVSVESELVFVAKQQDPFELEQHWKQMRYQADREAAEEAEEEQRKQAWLSLRKTWWGNYKIEGELDPENGATLATALRAIMGRKAGDDDRTPMQRRAAALGELARRRLDAGDLPERGGERPHLMLVADLATLRLEPGSRMAQLDWATLVTGQTARRIAEDAAITPVLVDEGKVLHVGRRSRAVPAPVRRALNLRDQGCRAPGCTMPPDLCTPHHERHWADGGSPDLANLTLYCDHHHGKRHPENARFRTPARGSLPDG